MLTCQEITELIDDFIDGRLSYWEAAKFQMHVGMCKNCREYLSQLKATRQALGSLPEPEIPAEVEGELLARFRDWKTKPLPEPGDEGEG